MAELLLKTEPKVRTEETSREWLAFIYSFGGCDASLQNTEWITGFCFHLSGPLHKTVINKYFSRGTRLDLDGVRFRDQRNMLVFERKSCEFGPENLRIIIAYYSGKCDECQKDI